MIESSTFPSDTTWAIITGEYPPDPGGVAAYSRQVARGLVQAGDRVHVLCPKMGQPVADDGVSIHPLRANFDSASRAESLSIIRSLPQPRRVLVQYVPHAFGARAMNVGFARWVRRLARGGESVDVMFHEVAYPREIGQPMKHRFLAWVNRRMARWIVQSSRRVFVSTSGWIPLLRSIGFNGPVAALPVPSNVLHEPNPTAVNAIRRRINAETIVGHFGSYGPLMNTLSSVLRLIGDVEPSRAILLLGRGSDAFAAELIQANPHLAGRIHASGMLDAADIADHLAACDVMVQPYPNGVSCRRGSTMAAIALGVPVVTSTGMWTESLWSQRRAVAMAASDQAADMAAAVEACLSDRSALKALGERGRILYESEFSIDRTVRSLRDFQDANSSSIASQTN